MASWVVTPREEGDCQAVAVSDQEGEELVLKAVFMPKLVGGEKTD